MPNIDLGKVVGEQGPEGPAAQGTMTEATYDPNGKSQDVFAYADAAKQEAKDYAAPKTHASQHASGGSDPVTPADIGAVAVGDTVNPNLLDNWYFANPVNQRGQTEYTGNVYCIDRWKINTGEKAIVSDGYLRVECTASSGRSFAQIVGENLDGKTVTFSVLIKEISNTATAYVSNSSGSTLKSMSITGPGLWSMTVTIPADVTSILVQVNPTVVGDTLDLIAAKLELGSQQTLAHQDTDGNWVLNEIPDYGEQLARCQRYALALSKQSGHSVYGSGMINSGQNARIVVPLPVTMRTAPTVTKLGDLEILANGTTYVVTSVSVESLSPTAVCIVANSTSLSTKQAATPALLRSSGLGKGELFLSADL